MPFDDLQMDGAVTPDSTDFWAPDHWFADPALGPVPMQDAPADFGVPIDAAPPIPPQDFAAPHDVAPPGPPPVDSALAGYEAGPLPYMAPEQAPPEPPTTQQAPSVAMSPDVSVHMEQPGEFPAPDAISGAGGAPAMPGEPVTLTPEQHYQQSVAALHGESPFDEQGNVRFDNDAEAQRYFSELRVRNPVKFAEYAGQLADIKTKRTLAENQRIANDDWKWQQRIAEERKAAAEVARQKTADLDRRATELANTKVGELSPWQRITGVVAAIIGGLYQGKSGSARNPGLDAFNEVVNRQIANQREDLANKRAVLGQERNTLAEEYARTGDMAHSEDVMRLAALRHAHDELDRQQQEYSPRGTTFMRIAQQKGDLLAAQANIIEQRRKAHEAEEWKKREFQLKVDKDARDAWHQRAQIGLGYANLDEQRAQRQESKLARLDEKERVRADKQAENERQFSIGGIPRVRTDQSGKPALGPEGKPVIDYDVLRNSDGSVWLAESPEATRELRQKKTSAEEGISMIDEILAIRGRVGGETSLLNSDERQRLEVLQARSRLITKESTQGMSSDKDGEVLSDAAGTGNAASWRDQTARLLEARARTESALNKAFRNAKYSGPAITFPQATPAQDTPEDDAKQLLHQKPDESVDSIVQRRLDKLQAERGAPLDISNPEDAALYHKTLAEAREQFDAGASTEQRAQIDNLGHQLAGPKANDARATLKSIATTANTPRLRELAQDQLDSGERQTILALGSRGATDAPDAVAARAELQRLAKSAGSDKLRALADNQLNAIARLRYMQAPQGRAAAPPPSIPIPPELQLDSPPIPPPEGR